MLFSPRSSPACLASLSADELEASSSPATRTARPRRILQQPEARAARTGSSSDGGFSAARCRRIQQFASFLPKQPNVCRPVG